MYGHRVITVGESILGPSTVVGCVAFILRYCAVKRVILQLYVPVSYGPIRPSIAYVSIVRTVNPQHGPLSDFQGKKLQCNRDLTRSGVIFDNYALNRGLRYLFFTYNLYCSLRIVQSLRTYIGHVHV